MRRLVTAFAAVTALVSGAAVLKLKLVVQDKASQVQALADQIHKDQEAIRVLDAEWAYLTTPRALENQSAKFLALMPPRASQVLTNPDVIPFRPRSAGEVEDPGVLLPSREQKKEKSRPAQSGLQATSTDKPQESQKGQAL